MDNVSKEKRSEIMRSVKSKNTVPEKKVRSLLHRMGYRFRIGGSKLPGHPDIVLKKYMTCIFVHGCFWHQHDGCRKSVIPKSNQSFWHDKFEKNKLRHEKNVNLLQEMGWNVEVIWECEIKNSIQLFNRLNIIFQFTGVHMTNFKQ